MFALFFTRTESWTLDIGHSYRKKYLFRVSENACESFWIKLFVSAGVNLIIIILCQTLIIQFLNP